MFAPILKDVFNLSLMNDAIPENCIYYIVAPIFKSGNCSDVSHYHPVFCLNEFSKVF